MVDNRLFYGDNLEMLRRHVPAGTVDLVYLDPPFNSNRSHNVIVKPHDVTADEGRAQIQAFDDTWIWTPATEQQYAACVGGELPGRVADALVAFRALLGENDLMAYLVNLAPRLVELRRVLRSTGSLYLHCDQVMSHHLKVLLDTLFGADRFQNEIVWHHGLGAMSARRRLPSKHDVIFWYSKGDRPTFNRLRGDVTPAMAKKYSHEDEHGRYMMSYGKRYYLQGGKPLDDVWEIPAISPTSAERLGYPTQKPLALLERIIEMGSNEGDVVLDPFCGCGTTVDAAQKLGRRWLGMDVAYIAVDLIERRLQHTHGESIRGSYEVLGVPRNLRSALALLARSPSDFRRWVVSLVNAQPNSKQAVDPDVDGVGRFRPGAGGTVGRILISVKGGGQGTPSMVRDLGGAVAAQNAEMGVLVTSERPTRAMIDEADRSGGYRHPDYDKPFPRIQIITVDQLLSGIRPRTPPTLTPYIQALRA